VDKKMTKLQTQIWNETITVEMDVTDASSRVLFNGKAGQLQTADFKHNIYDALKGFLNVVCSEGGEDSLKFEEEIEYAIERAEEIED
jgi:hypothetical protein